MQRIIRGRSSEGNANPNAESDEVPYNSLPIPDAVEERPTEDDLAQAALGGPKGSPNLPPAPLTKQEEEQNLPNSDPGHVA